MKFITIIHFVSDSLAAGHGDDELLQERILFQIICWIICILFGVCFAVYLQDFLLII